MKRILSIALAGALCASALAACGGSSSSTAASSAPAASSEAASSQAASSEAASVENGLQIGQAYAAAHGTDSFAYAVAVVQGDTIVAAYLDEFQFMDPAAGAVGVPNSDADFGADYPEGMVLASKRQSNDYYSEMMTSYANATVSIVGNFDAIEDYAAGKTIDELSATASSEDAVDAVSGATLADTAGYLNAIAEAARNAQQNQAVAYDGDFDQLTLHVGYGAAHGTKCFTLASALTDGERIVLSYLDDLQFMCPTATAASARTSPRARS